MREKKRLLELAGLDATKILGEARDIEIQMDFDEPSVEAKETMNSLRKAGFSSQYKPRGGKDFIVVPMPSTRLKKSDLADWITDNLLGDEEDTLGAYPELFEEKLHEQREFAEVSVPVRPYGNFDDARDDTKAAIRKAEAMFKLFKKETKNNGRIKLVDVDFNEFDSSNVSHANAMFEIEIEADADTLAAFMDWY